MIADRLLSSLLTTQKVKGRKVVLIKSRKEREEAKEDEKEGLDEFESDED